MSPGRLEIGKEEGLREKQIKGTQILSFSCKTSNESYIFLEY